MNKNKHKNKNMVVIGIAVVAISVAIAFGVWEVQKQKQKPKSQLPKCTSIKPLPDTDAVKQQCENIQEKDLCRALYATGTDNTKKLCQWTG